jgi:hypothetical protein
MHYTPRTIALLCELHHPILSPDPAPVQKVHNQMFQSGAPAYTSFAVTPVGAVLSNAVGRPGASSSASFLADRFTFREELGSLTIEEFAARVRQMSEQVGALCGIQVFTSQVVTVRSLVNPRNFRDSRAFLKQGMFGFGAELESFGRDPLLYGMRMVFPPEKEAPNSFALRIESFNNDPRSLYLENQGTFPPIFVERGMEQVEENVLATYRFLTDRALRFVGCFDARQEA